MLHLNSQELEDVCVFVCFLFHCSFYLKTHVTRNLHCKYIYMFILCTLHRVHDLHVSAISWVDCMHGYVWLFVYCVWCKCLYTWDFFIWMTSLIQYTFPSFASFCFSSRHFFLLFICLFGVSFEIYHSHLILGNSWNVPSIKVTSCFTFNFADT